MISNYVHTLYIDCLKSVKKKICIHLKLSVSGFLNCSLGKKNLNTINEFNIFDQGKVLCQFSGTQYLVSDLIFLVHYRNLYQYKIWFSIKYVGPKETTQIIIIFYFIYLELFVPQCKNNHINFLFGVKCRTKLIFKLSNF